MGAKRNKNDVISSTDEIKIVAPSSEQPMLTEQTEAEVVAEALTEEKKVVKKKGRVRSGKYVAVRAQIDKTKKYDAFAAVELLKKLSYTSFPGTITAHILVKEVGTSAPLTLPHSTGQSLRVAIVTDALLADIAAGKIEFDMLVSAPQFMPKLAKFASTLGPKGLMPNPKNGTLTPNPEAQKKLLEGGTVTIKTEKKAPLFHIQIGKTTMETKALVENIEAIMKALNGRITRFAIAATMSPGIKVTVV